MRTMLPAQQHAAPLRARYFGLMVVLRKESAYCLKTRGGRGRSRTSSLLAPLNSKTLSEEAITDRVQSLRKQLGVQRFCNWFCFDGRRGLSGAGIVRFWLAVGLFLVLLWPDRSVRFRVFSATSPGCPRHPPSLSYPRLSPGGETSRTCAAALPVVSQPLSFHQLRFISG